MHLSFWGRVALGFLRLALLCAAWANTGLADEAWAQAGYRLRRWTSSEGLPQNTVRCLLQSRDGYLWIGTRAGLARFDGLNFTVFNTARVAGMLNDNCVTLAEDNEGGIWVGTENGLLRWKDQKMTAFSQAEIGFRGEVRALAAGATGGVWIGTRGGGLLYYKGGMFKRYSTEDGLQANNIRALFEDRAGTVWAGTEMDDYHGGLQFKKAGRPRFESLRDYPTSWQYMTHAISENSKGKIFWGNNLGLQQLGETKSQTWSVKDGLSGNVVKWLGGRGDSDTLTVLCGERLNEVPGNGGVHLLRNGTVERIDLPELRLGNDLICCIQDHEGSLWVGTRYDGLLQLQKARMSVLNSANGLANDYVRSVCSSKESGIWALDTEAVTRIRPGAIDIFERMTIMSIDAPLTAFGEGPEGVMWVANSHGLSGRFNPQNLRLDDALGPHFHGTQAHVIYLARSRHVWFGAVSGVYDFAPPFDNAPTFWATTDDGHSLADICAILEDRSGAFWFGSKAGGLFRLQHGSWTRFTTQNGLSDNRVRTLFEDTEGCLWIGAENGLNRYKNARFISIHTQQGLVDNRIHQIIEDDLGNLWFSCLKGIFKATRSALQALADGVTNHVHCISYGQMDGMPTVETSGDRQPAGCKSSDGRLWFATPKGIVVIDPATIQDDTTEPSVLIEQVNVGGQLIFGEGGDLPAEGWARAGSPFHLDPNRARLLDIRFTANTFKAPEQVQFRYKLDGHDASWVSASSSTRRAIYTNLRPGTYTFTVKACNNHGYWNEKGASFAFILPPKFTQTGWFPFALILGGATISLALFTWRLRWQRRAFQAEQTAAVERERARIARDLHDDLGASLTGIALQLEAGHRQGRAEGAQLAALAGEARSLAHGLRELAWTTNPRCDNAGSLGTFLGDMTERFCAAAGLECRLDLIPADNTNPVSARVRHELLMVTKESLTNVAKHAQAKSIHLKVELRDRRLSLMVRDDGRGFDPSHLNGGSGLLNMRERIENAGGEFLLESIRGAGAVIHATIPLEEAKP